MRDATSGNHLLSRYCATDAPQQTVEITPAKSVIVEFYLPPQTSAASLLLHPWSASSAEAVEVWKAQPQRVPVYHDEYDDGSDVDSQDSGYRYYTDYDRAYDMMFPRSPQRRARFGGELLSSGHRSFEARHEVRRARPGTRRPDIMSRRLLLQASFFLEQLAHGG